MNIVTGYEFYGLPPFAQWSSSKNLLFPLKFWTLASEISLAFIGQNQVTRKSYYDVQNRSTMPQTLPFIVVRCCRIVLRFLQWPGKSERPQIVVRC